MLKGLLAMILTLGLASAAPATEPVRLIPLRDFFRNPEQTAFRISPDGRKIAWLAPWKGRMNVYVRAVDGTEAVRLTSATERDVPFHFWSGSERIVYLQDQGGNEDFHLFAVTADGKGTARELTPFDKARVNIVDDLEDDDRHLLISMNRRDPRIFDVYRINVDTGTMEVVAENPGTVAGWLTDHEGRLRVAVTHDGVESRLLYRETEGDSFEVLMTTDFKDSFSPLLFSYDNRDLYVSSNLGRDKAAIFRWDPRTKETKELIFEHPEVDVYNLISSRKRKVITGVTYTTDRRRYHFFDGDRKALQEKLETLLPGGLEVAVSGMSRDERRVIVRTYGDRSLGAAYVYDRDTEQLTRLAEISPWLKAEEMAPQQPIQYTARDGLIIHGYLTLPVGREAKKLPVVVNPHGGPWHRDVWGFDPQVQFLANRGYAVLQMNFRGSTGYGRAFWAASFKQWGKAMQDDITDGVKWLIDQGIADPQRIGIYGASYGGYATLAGLAFTPELYACGVDYVGVSNIFTLLSTMPPYWELGRKMMYEMVGNPETEKELLTAASPLFHVDRMKAPLFVAQGANDPRVKKSESDQIVEALKKRGIDVPYMVKDNEGHGFQNEENRFAFYAAMEEFLAKHLGGRCEQ